MYAPYFGLSHEPFSIAPDPRYLFMSERHREALAHLLYGLGGGGGFVLLTGEIGTGKTTVCRCFLEQIPQSCNVAYIFNPKLTVTELLQSICEEFRLPLPLRDSVQPTVKDYLDPLNTFLLQAHAHGRNSVLIIDEAQNLSEDVLEQLRLLTNLETSERKLLQVVLIGQPELRAMLARPGLEQLAQRVIARYHLDALSPGETALYVRHRLEVAGLSRALPFEPRALVKVHKLSGGVPRRINLLCDRALLGAFAGSEAMVTPAVVQRAAREVFPLAPPTHPWPAVSPGWLVAGAAAIGAVIGVAVTRLVPSGAVVRAASSTQAPAAVAAQRATLPASLASGPLAGSKAAVPRAALASAPGVHAAVEELPTMALPSLAAPAGPAPARLLGDEKQAWRELARAWQADPGNGEPCAALARQSLVCFMRVTPLTLVRQLDRPGIVVLDRDRGMPSYAVLTAVGERTATLAAGGSVQTVTLAALAERWNGEWGTLWRSPPGDGRGNDRASPEFAQWVDRQLGAAGFADDVPLRTRIRSFQLAQGLPADGVLGPMTLMQLNRSAKVNEPRLRSLP
ncbi:MAG: ExeA family protein [Ramlibacter sp.]